MIADYRTIEFPNSGTLVERYILLKREISDILPATPTNFHNKYILNNAKFSKNQQHNINKLVFVDLKYFERLESVKTQKILTLIQGMQFLDIVWFYTDNKALNLKFAQQLIELKPTIDIWIVIETGITDEEGNFKIEVEDCILTQFDTESKDIIVNELSHTDLILYSTKHMFRFWDDYVVIPQFEIKHSIAKKIYKYKDENKHPEILLKYAEMLQSMTKRTSLYKFPKYGLIVSLKSIKDVKFIFNKPYKSAFKYMQKQEYYTPLRDFMKINRMEYVNGIWNFLWALPDTTPISIKTRDYSYPTWNDEYKISKDYKIAEFINDLLISKWTPNFHTIPIPLSSMKIYPDLMSEFICRFTKIQKIMIQDDLFDCSEGTVVKLVKLIWESNVRSVFKFE